MDNCHSRQICGLGNDYDGFNFTALKFKLRGFKAAYRHFTRGIYNVHVHSRLIKQSLHFSTVLVLYFSQFEFLKKK